MTSSKRRAVAASTRPLLASAAVALSCAALASRVVPERRVVEGALALTAMVLCLLAVAAWLAGRRHPGRLALPALAAWWLAAETLAAPFLGGVLPLWHYDFMQDVDHRPRTRGPGDNADLLRGTPEREAFRPEGVNVVFLGDSFTYGFGVTPDEAFPSLVRAALRSSFPGAPLEVANFGWVSSSPLLSYRLLLDLGEAYHPAIVALCLDMTDFENDLVYQNMLDRRGLYGWYDRLPLALALFQRLAPARYARVLSASVGGAPSQRFFVTENPLEATRPWIAPMTANVAKIREWCRTRGTDFVVFVLPRHFQYDARECPHNWEAGEYTLLGPYSLEPFRYFDEFRGTVDYPIVSLLEPMRDAPERPLHQDHDPHWNPAGHAAAARAITPVLAPLVARRIDR